MHWRAPTMTTSKPMSPLYIFDDTGLTGETLWFSSQPPVFEKGAQDAEAARLFFQDVDPLF